MKIVGRGLDRARRELLRGARFAWGGLGAGASRMGWVSHGNTSCGERAACGGARGSIPLGKNSIWKKRHMGKIYMKPGPRGKQNRWENSTRERYHMGKIQHGKIPRGQHSTWETFHPHGELQLSVGGAESISLFAKRNSNKTIVRVLPFAHCGVRGLLFAPGVMESQIIFGLPGRDGIQM